VVLSADQNKIFGINAEYFILTELTDPNLRLFVENKNSRRFGVAS
jgi:hypothetical protein